EAGSTFIDFVCAVPVVAAYAVLLFRGRWLGVAPSWTVAGALIGIVTALKMTNGAFAIGAVGFALAGQDSLRQRLGGLVAFFLALVCTFVVIGGWWSFALWQRFGNPFFPMYNNVFHSPDAGASSGQDGRFLPHSVLDVWRYPLYWLFGGSPD